MFRLFRRSACDLAREKLSLYLDGDLSSRESQDVCQHLEQCEACRAELDALRATVELLHRVPAVLSPRSFALREALPAPRPRRAAFVGLRAATALAVIALATLVAGDWLNAFPSEPAPMVATEQGQTETLTQTAASVDAGTTLVTQTATAGMPAPTTATTVAGQTLPPDVPASTPTSDSRALTGEPPSMAAGGKASPEGLSALKAPESGDVNPTVQPTQAVEVLDTATPETPSSTEVYTSVAEGPTPVAGEMSSTPPASDILGDALTATGPGAGWPLRQIEWGLFGLVVILAAANIIYWRRLKFEGRAS